MVKSQAGPTGGDIGEGQVESIQNVNIEMHDEFSMRRAVTARRSAATWSAITVRVPAPVSLDMATR
jgi:hypothetical protein